MLWLTHLSSLSATQERDVKGGLGQRTRLYFKSNRNSRGNGKGNSNKNVMDRGARLERLSLKYYPRPSPAAG